MQGLEQLTRILLSRTPVTVALVPQLPHFEATSSAGGLVMDHWALSMIYDPAQRTHCCKPHCAVSLGAHTTLVFRRRTCLRTTGTALARPTHRRHRDSAFLQLGRRSQRNFPVPGRWRRVPPPRAPAPAVPTPAVPVPRMPRQTQTLGAKMRTQMRRRTPPGRRPSPSRLLQPPPSPWALPRCRPLPPFQTLDGAYGLQPLEVPREVPAKPTEQHQERRQRHQ